MRELPPTEENGEVNGWQGGRAVFTLALTPSGRLITVETAESRGRSARIRDHGHPRGICQERCRGAVALGDPPSGGDAACRVFLLAGVRRTLSDRILSCPRNGRKVRNRCRRRTKTGRPWSRPHRLSAAASTCGSKPFSNSGANWTTTPAARSPAARVAFPRGFTPAVRCGIASGESVFIWPRTNAIRIFPSRFWRPIPPNCSMAGGSSTSRSARPWRNMPGRRTSGPWSICWRRSSERASAARGSRSWSIRARSFIPCDGRPARPTACSRMPRPWKKAACWCACPTGGPRRRRESALGCPSGRSGSRGSEWTRCSTSRLVWHWTVRRSPPRNGNRSWRPVTAWCSSRADGWRWTAKSSARCSSNGSRCRMRPARTASRFFKACGSWRAPARPGTVQSVRGGNGVVVGGSGRRLAGSSTP